MPGVLEEQQEASVAGAVSRTEDSRKKSVTEACGEGARGLQAIVRTLAFNDEGGGH